MYFLSSIFIILLIPVILLFSIALPILIGVCVYRDASKRVDCSPLLWALVAALVPSFIGLVIYLIIRRDYPIKGGEGSTAYYQESYDGAVQRAGLPTWAKALIIIVAVIVVICLVVLAISAVYGFFQYGGSYSTGHSYYNGF